MRKLQFQITLAIYVIVILIAVAFTSVSAAPRSPAQPLSGCPTGTYGSFYNGFRVVITDTTLGQTLLDTTAPVRSPFQTEWDALGSNNSTDNYTVQAYAFVSNPGTPGVWLIDSSGLHC